jgi:hypothetical protein
MGTRIVYIIQYTGKTLLDFFFFNFRDTVLFCWDSVCSENHGMNKGQGQISSITV